MPQSLLASDQKSGIPKDPKANVGVASLVGLVRTAGKHTLATVARFATLTALAAPVRITMTLTLLGGAPAAKFTSLFGVHYAMLPNL